MPDLFTLGDLYVSDFLAAGESPRGAPAELRMVMDDDGLVHLSEQPPAELMWGRYWYRSGTNVSMTQELRDVVTSVQRVARLAGRDVWVDIACNDGTLLRQIDGDRVRIGVDPADGSFARQAKEWCDAHFPVPFDSGIAGHIRREYGPAKVITCIAMFYDLMDPTDFLAGVVDLLADDGMFVLQLSYTPLMIEQLAFDNICHEHARYYTLNTLAETLAAAGLVVVDCTLNDVNGGSMRVFARKLGADEHGWASAPHRDVAMMRVGSLLTYEDELGYNEPQVWERFWLRLQSLRADVRSFVEAAGARGESVWAYGASTKGNTLLQFFGLDHTLISGAAERQEQKWGLRTVGTDIPIHSEKYMRSIHPDYLLMLPWHFVSEFVDRESRYLASGGRFLVPCPRFEVIAR